MKEVVLVVLVEEGMVVVEGLDEEEHPYIMALLEEDIMELEEAILEVVGAFMVVVVDMEEEEEEEEEGLEEVVEWEDQGISSSMEL